MKIMLKHIKQFSISGILFLFILMMGCDKPVMEKPDNLIPEDKMIEMMADIHLAESTYKNLRNRDSIVGKSTSADFYYSVLEKYEVADSTFEKSYVFYASKPRDFEKMYRQVMNKLNEMEQSFSGRKEDLLQLKPDETKP